MEMLERVKRFVEIVKEEDLKIEAILLSNVDNILFEHHLVPNHKRNIYSHSKSFTSAMVGIALYEKKISLDDHLVDYIKDEISEEEKEYKSKRKQIQEKLIKFATRIPIFMYLTDFREQVLQDVITQLEPGLFKRVTGLEVKDFELLTSLGLFNAGLMNQAVFQFRRYEDSSLSYTGINKHEGELIGGWDTTIHYEDMKKI